MFSSPLMRRDRTVLPGAVREWIADRLSGPPRRKDAAEASVACIYKVDRLGDFVLALTAIRRLLDHFGPDRCQIVVSEAAAVVAQFEFPHTPRLVLPTDAPGILRNVVPLWWRRRPAFCGITTETRICLTHQRDLYREVSLSWIHTAHDLRMTRATFPTEATADLCLDLEAHRRLVGQAVGHEIATDEIRPRFTSLAASDNGRLLVCPFASEAVRCLPESLLVAALRQWRTRSSAPIDFCAAPDDSGKARALVEACRNAGIGGVSIVTPASTIDFLKCVAAAGAVLATDSAAAHIATALDKPACTILGGGAFGLCLPWRRSKRQTVLSHLVPCYGCGWRCHEPEVYCLTQVAPDAIAAALPVL